MHSSDKHCISSPTGSEDSFYGRFQLSKKEKQVEIGSLRKISFCTNAKSLNVSSLGSALNVWISPLADRSKGISFNLYWNKVEIWKSISMVLVKLILLIINQIIDGDPHKCSNSKFHSHFHPVLIVTCFLLLISIFLSATWAVSLSARPLRL